MLQYNSTGGSKQNITPITHESGDPYKDMNQSFNQTFAGTNNQYGNMLDVRRNNIMGETTTNFTNRLNTSSKLTNPSS